MTKKQERDNNPGFAEYRHGVNEKTILQFVVDVYRNLRDGGYSLRAHKCPPGHEHLKNKVIAQMTRVWLGNNSQSVQFIVNQKTRERVVRTRHKEVHAFARGFISVEATKITEPKTKITYNPLKYKEFVILDSKKEVKIADQVLLTENGVYITESSN